MTAPRQARSLWRRGLPILVAVAVAFLGQAVPASGHPEKPGLKLGHGGPGGHSHREDPHKGIEEAGFHDLDNTGFHTDIMPWVSEDGRVFAATGTWGTVLQPGQDCPSETDDPFAPHDSGVKIIEATDPENPEKVAHLGTIPGAQNNDVKVARLPRSPVRR